MSTMKPLLALTSSRVFYAAKTGELVFLTLFFLPVQTVVVLEGTGVGWWNGAVGWGVREGGGHEFGQSKD